MTTNRPVACIEPKVATYTGVTVFCNSVHNSIFIIIVFSAILAPKFF